MYYFRIIDAKQYLFCLRFNMTSEVASLTFRAAQPADYEGVLAMSGPGHYEGYDYIPDWYDMLVKSPNRRSFVGEIGKKIVSKHLTTKA